MGLPVTLLGLATAALLALAPAAHAGELKVEAGKLVFTGGGENDNITVSFLAGVDGASSSFRVAISGATTTYVAPCTGPSFSSPTASCPAAGVGSIALAGGEGHDTLTVAEAVTTGARLDGGWGNDALNGGGGPDTLIGGPGLPSQCAYFIDHDADALHGRGGTDVADYSGHASSTYPAYPASLSLNDLPDDGQYGCPLWDNGTMSGDTAGENDNLHSDIENVTGTPNNDFISGSAGPNRLDGDLGADMIHGHAGDDEIRSRDGWVQEDIDCGPGFDTAVEDATDNLSGCERHAPSSSGPPAIAGTARAGDVLSVGDGSWVGSPETYTYEWRRCDATGNACASISSATDAAYTATDADVGHRLRVFVTGTNVSGSASATSAPSGLVLERPPMQEAGAGEQQGQQQQQQQPGGSASPPVPAPTAADTRAPTVSLTVPKQRLRAVLKNGLRFSAELDEAGALDAELVLAGRTAKKLNLNRTGAAFSVGQFSSNLAAPARIEGTITFSARARRALRRSKRTVLTLQASATDGAGNAARALRALSLRR